MVFESRYGRSARQRICNPSIWVRLLVPAPKLLYLVVMSSTYITDEKVCLVLTLLLSGNTYRAIGKEIHVSYGTVSRIAREAGHKPSRLRRNKKAHGVCKNCGGETKKRGNSFCSSLCHSAAAHEVRYSAFLADDPTAFLGPHALRRAVIQRDGLVCSFCGLTEWMGSPIPIELHHIDGNSDNNRSSNLTLHCPNCHALTPTYRAKNAGRGRHKRRERFRNGKSY
jgi:hypothetical protein